MISFRKMADYVFTIRGRIATISTPVAKKRHPSQALKYRPVFHTLSGSSLAEGSELLRKSWIG